MNRKGKKDTKTAAGKMVVPYLRASRAILRIGRIEVHSTKNESAAQKWAKVFEID